MLLQFPDASDEDLEMTQTNFHATPESGVALASLGGGVSLSTRNGKRYLLFGVVHIAQGRSTHANYGSREVTIVDGGALSVSGLARFPGEWWGTVHCTWHSGRSNLPSEVGYIPSRRSLLRLLGDANSAFSVFRTPRVS